MAKNTLDIKTLLNRLTDNQTDCFLFLGQVTEKIEKANPSHFLKFLFASLTNGTFGFALTHKTKASQNQKSRFFSHAHKDFVLNSKLTSKFTVQ
jgi:hypothetical protein